MAQFKLKAILLFCLVAFIAIASKHSNLQQNIHLIHVWVKHLGWSGAILYMVIYNLATLVFVPGSILAIAGGVFFGLFWGSVYVLIAATIGATLAFLIGRYLSRDWVARKIARHPKFKAIDRAVAKEGLKIVFLSRLSPILPFNLLNYAFGITQVSLKDYIVGSFGMIPGTVMYAYIGSLTSVPMMMHERSNHPETQIVQWVIGGIGFIATIALTVYMGRIAKGAIDQSI
jgi:uncharacterized membrane protein YdjX (TVP38/TMEM64 family)